MCWNARRGFAYTYMQRRRKLIPLSSESVLKGMYFGHNHPFVCVWVSAIVGYVKRPQAPILRSIKSDWSWHPNSLYWLAVALPRNAVLLPIRWCKKKKQKHIEYIHRTPALSVTYNQLKVHSTFIRKVSARAVVGSGAGMPCSDLWPEKTD